MDAVAQEELPPAGPPLQSGFTQHSFLPLTKTQFLPYGQYPPPIQHWLPLGVQPAFAAFEAGVARAAREAAGVALTGHRSHRGSRRVAGLGQQRSDAEDGVVK